MICEWCHHQYRGFMCRLQTATPPVLVDSEEDVALNDGLINFPPAFKNHITWDEHGDSVKQKGHKGNVSLSKSTRHPLRMHRANICTWMGWRGNGQRTLWPGQYVYAFLLHTSRFTIWIYYIYTISLCHVELHKSLLIHLQILGGGRRDELAGRASSDGSCDSEMSAVPQWQSANATWMRS